MLGMTLVIGYVIGMVALGRWLFPKTRWER